MTLLERLFLTKEIRSKNGTLHFRRWRLLSTPWFSIFLHQIYKSDTDHSHDHPWDFLAIILNGGYREYCNDELEFRFRSPGSIFFKSASETHTFSLEKPTTSLIITGPRKREWGYRLYEGWIDNKTYRSLKRQNKLFEPYDKVRFENNTPNHLIDQFGIIKKITIENGELFATVRWESGIVEKHLVWCLIRNICNACNEEAKYSFQTKFWCENCYNDWCLNPKESQPQTLNLAQIREGAKRASARFETWPQWKKDLSGCHKSSGEQD